MSDEIDFLMHQHQQQTEFQRKQRKVRARQHATLERNTNKDYPEEYKDYIRRTSGRPV